MVFKRWHIIAGIAVLVVSTMATALSLGRVRGTALIGRSLDLSVQSSLDAQEATPDASCLAAEVFYGDTRVSPNSVSVSPVRSAGGELNIRIRSSAIVDEPVVTLFVRSTCGASISRRYVLLAEALTEAEPTGASGFNPALTPAAPPALLSTPRTAFGGALPSAPGADRAANSSSAQRAERAAKRQAQREARAEKTGQAAAELPQASGQRTAPPVSVVRKSANTGAPRLKIDLVDLTAAEPSLRSSAELSSAPATDEAVRRQAQAIWRSLNASPEDAMKEAQLLEGLQAQMRQAQDQSKRQGQDIASLTTQLKAAEKARYINPLTIALGLISLAALAACLYLWQRGRSAGQPWWGGAAKALPKDEQHLWKHLGETPESIVQPLQKQTNSSFSPNPTLPTITSSESSSKDSANRTGAFAASSVPSSVRVGEKSVSFQDSRPPVEQRAFANSRQPTGTLTPSSRGGNTKLAANASQPSFQDSSLARSGKNSGFSTSDFVPGGFASPRVVAAEELFDIQEQADFFLSLGQPDQAIEVLKNHITDNVETSALAYMDLFDIYHRSNRRSDYAELREEFNRVFNAQVPEFADYGEQSNGLEEYPQVLGNIQAVWGKSQQAQDVIEESIFRQPEQDQTLDMTAYRELMLLYALAKELSRPDAAYSMLPVSTQTTVLPAGGLLNTPDVDLGDGLVLSSPMDDLLSPEDRTVSLPHPLLKSSDQPKDDGSLDFDLSDSAELSIIKKPSAPKKV